MLPRVEKNTSQMLNNTSQDLVSHSMSYVWSDRDLFVVSITRESIRAVAAGLNTRARARIIRPLFLRGWVALPSRGDSDIFVES